MKRIFWSSLLGASLLAPSAYARDGRSEGWFAIFMAGAAIPSEIGQDRAIAKNAQPRLRVGWAYQIPFGMFASQSENNWAFETSSLWQHRVVLSLSLLYGVDGQAGSRGFRLEALDFRGGYRYRFRHWNGLAPYMGVGLGIGGAVIDAIQVVPSDGKAYFSPELGIHFGRDSTLRPGVQLGIQSEFFVGTPPRIQAVAAWTLW